MADNSITVQCSNPREIRLKTDRRSHLRFPLGLALRWRTARRDFADGRAVNMSSRGLLIAAADAPKVGTAVEVAVEWPVLLGGGVGLLLCFSGRVVRSGAGAFAVQYTAYEFRTRKAPGVVGVEERAA
jgi:hypothetical protein